MIAVAWAWRRNFNGMGFGARTIHLQGEDDRTYCGILCEGDWQFDVIQNDNGFTCMRCLKKLGKADFKRPTFGLEHLLQ